MALEYNHYPDNLRMLKVRAAKLRNQANACPKQKQVLRDPWRQRFPRQFKPQGDQQPDGGQVVAHED